MTWPIDAAGQGDVPPPGPLRTYHFGALADFSLPNGVRVIVARRPALPIVTASVLVGAGSVYETPTDAGIAHLAAQLLRESSSAGSGDSVAEQIDALGARWDALANLQYAGLTVTSLRTRFPEAFRLVAAGVRAPRFDSADVWRVRARAVADLEQRAQTPMLLAFDLMTRASFGTTSANGRPVEGMASTVATLTRDRLAAWYDRYYHPSRTTVVIVGDISPDEARSLLEATLGTWRGRGNGIRPPITPPFSLASGAGSVIAASTSTAASRPGSRVILVDRPGAEQTAMVLGHVAPRPADVAYLPLLVANRVLGGGTSARLSMNLRERRALAYHANSYIEGRPDASVFSIEASVRTNATDSALIEALVEYRRILREPLPLEEVRAAVQGLAGSFPNSVQTVQGLRGRLINTLTWGLPLQFYATYREGLADVTPARTTHALAQAAASGLTIVLVGDISRFEQSVRSLGIASLEVWTPDGTRVR